MIFTIEERMGKGIFLFIGVASLSASAIFVRLANAPSSITAFYRLLFSFILILPMIILKKSNIEELKSITKKEMILCIISGLSLAGHYSLWFQSLKFTSVASSTVIVTLQPLFSLIFGYFIFKERYTKMALSGFVIAIIGSIIIGWGDFQISPRALFGDFLSLIAAALISVNFIIGQYVRRKLSVVNYIGLTYFPAFIFLGIFSFIIKVPFTGYLLETWIYILCLTLISTMLGHFVFTWLLKWFSATVISMTILGEAVGACILGYFILNESVSLKQTAGIVIILFGIGLFLKESQKVK